MQFSGLSQLVLAVNMISAGMAPHAHSATLSLHLSPERLYSSNLQSFENKLLHPQGQLMDRWKSSRTMRYPHVLRDDVRREGYPTDNNQFDLRFRLSNHWGNGNLKNALFPVESYSVFSVNPPNRTYIHNLAEEALARFVERAVEDGVAQEINEPAQYPTKGIIDIQRNGIVRFYNTSNIMAAMFGLFTDQQGNVIHFKPNMRDLSLAFEGLPIRGVPIEVEPGYREDVDRLDPRDHNWGPTSYRRQRAWAFFFGEFNDLPVVERNRLVYRMGQRLMGLDENQAFFRQNPNWIYEDALAQAKKYGREQAFLDSMNGLAHRNASAYAYYRLSSSQQDDPFDLLKEYEYSLNRHYLPQREERLRRNR